MATLTLGGKTVLTQTGSDEPVLGSNLTGSPNFDLSSSTFPSGHILQVQYTQFDSTATMTSISNNTHLVICDGTAGSGTEILNVTITPRKTGSTMWCQFCFHFEPDAGINNNYDMVWLLNRVSSGSTTHLRNTDTNITGRRGIGLTAQGYYSADPDTTMDVVNFQYFDLHGVTAGVPITYKPIVFTNNSMTRMTINRVEDNSSYPSNEGAVSNLVIIEIAP